MTNSNVVKTTRYTVTVQIPMHAHMECVNDENIIGRPYYSDRKARNEIERTFYEDCGRYFAIQSLAASYQGKFLSASNEDGKNTAIFTFAFDCKKGLDAFTEGLDKAVEEAMK